MKKLLLLLLVAAAIPAFAQHNIQFRSLLPYGVQASNIWGWADSTGKEYALVGLETGVSIVDVTDPDNVNEVQFVNSPQSTWREIKTWGHYAYVTNETSGGLLIIDLSNLPATVDTAWWTAGTEQLNSAHTIFIDENGYAYINGFNVVGDIVPTDERGCMIANLNPDPMHPVLAGKYQGNYVHDCYARNDTLWTADIYQGIFEVINVTDKANPVVMADQATPSSFTHNCWLSDDGTKLFTTDERGGAYVTAYEVSDLNNITELDRYQSSPGANVIPHNTYVVNGQFLVTSYYKDGVTIVDASDPTNLIETGQYDTSPFISSDGFNGAWGVYPYLPSGNLIVSDMEEGLFVLTPTYVQAAHLTGPGTNMNSGNNVADVDVQIIGTSDFDLTNFDGEYKTGAGETGAYDVRFTHGGCYSRIITGVALTTGTTTILNTQLDCDGVGIANVDAPEKGFIYGAANGTAMSIYYGTGQNDPASTGIYLYDMKGSLLRTWPAATPQGRIDLMDDIAGGMYIVKMQSGNTIRSAKVVKM
jgi:choice-of-anchor B domain-containing protein